MALKTFRPLTPSARFKALPSFEEITKKKPEKSLVTTRKRTGGRNNQGRLTCRHIGGGHKRKLRLIDFKRRKHGVIADVVAIEYPAAQVATIVLLFKQRLLLVFLKVNPFDFHQLQEDLEGDRC